MLILYMMSGTKECANLIHLMMSENGCPWYWILLEHTLLSTISLTIMGREGSGEILLVLLIDA